LFYPVSKSRPKLAAGEVCSDGCVTAANTAFFHRDWRIRRRDRAGVPGNSAKKRRIQASGGAKHAAVHADKAAIAGGVSPMDGATGTQGILNFGTASLEYFLWRILYHKFIASSGAIEKMTQPRV
jgi:hypothetical protein